jgi:hypothetical protein
MVMTWRRWRSSRSPPQQARFCRFLCGFLLCHGVSIALTRIGADAVTAADMSAAFKAWAAESHAFARNTSYAPALLDDLDGGKGAHLALQRRTRTPMR